MYNIQEICQKIVQPIKTTMKFMFLIIKIKIKIKREICHCRMKSPTLDMKGMFGNWFL